MNKISKREKILLIILLVIIVAVCWYKFAYEPLNNSIEELNNLRDSEQSEIIVMQPKIKKMRDMEQELVTLRADGNAVQIPRYDNSKPLMVALNKIMATADSYQIDFGEADKDDYIFIHKIHINFKTDSYQAARKIINRLATETFVNQISDVVIKIESKDIVETTKDGKAIVDTVETANVSLVITFFEVD